LACLDSVLDTVRAPNRVIVVDDASPEPELRHALDELAAARRITLLRHAQNRGFPASANAGMAAARGNDVVLLNSDTLVPAGWIERLREAAYSAPGIGTATPLSNNASILSYPGAPAENPTPDLGATQLLDAATWRANTSETVDIPVGVGFCLYLRRDCLDAVGPFRTDVFAQGYGEENDFCLRARRLGWRHVAATGVFVAHQGGASFGGAGRHLQLRNERLLRRLHPGYDRLVAEFCAADPLAEARRRLDVVRWRAAMRGTQGAAILITHDDGGGVEHQVGVSAAVHRKNGLRPIVLRPGRRPGEDALVVVDGAAAGFPNLRYALPGEMPALLRLLRAARPVVAEVHHTLHHTPAIYDLVTRLAVPYDVFIHDYVWFCPQVALVGLERRYCGEPAVAQCEACVADAGRIIDERISVQALRDRSGLFLAAARHVFAPSADAAKRMRAHFAGQQVDVAPQGDDAAIADPPPPRAHSGRCRVCLLGAIGLHKGYDILLSCARDAAERQLPLDFVVVGHTIDDARLLATGRVFITGRYEPDEAVPLVRAQQASLALLPSIWPETWSLGLTELWRAGLQVAAFDIGAPAERIRHTGRGFVLPLGLPPRGINNAVVAAVGLTGHVGTRNIVEPVRHPVLSKSQSINHGTNATTAGRAHA
jgi:GT2 family glycosyltransferase